MSKKLPIFYSALMLTAVNLALRFVWFLRKETTITHGSEVRLNKLVHHSQMQSQKVQQNQSRRA